MANGKYHGKGKFGIKITNPLTLVVSVVIKSPTGALHTGDGKETWRTIKPGETLFIPTKGKCEVDINPSIVRYDEVGNTVKLGDATFYPVQRVASSQAVPQPGPVLISAYKDVHSGRWVTVAEWKITRGFLGILRGINVEVTADCSAKVIIAGNNPINVSRDVEYDGKCLYNIHRGESVRVKAHAVGGGHGICRVIIQGELYPTGTVVPAKQAGMAAPEHITVRKDSKEPEEPLRSLGDMIEHMRQEEDVVKV